MSYKISGTEVISDSRKGSFTIANVGTFTPANRPTSGISAGDIIYNSESKLLEVYDGSTWIASGGAGGKSPHATGGNVIFNPSGYTHIFYNSGPIKYKGSSTGPMTFKTQIIGGGGGGGGDTGAGGGGAGEYAVWTATHTNTTTNSGYVTIGAGGAGGIGPGRGSDGSFTSDYSPSRAGAGGGGGGGAPGTLPGRPGTSQPGYSISGSGGGGCAWQGGSSASGAPGGTGSSPGSNPERVDYQNPGGPGYYQWWAPGNPSNWGIGGYYTGAGGGGAGDAPAGIGPGPGPGTNTSSTYPGGRGRYIQLGNLHSSWVAWGGGGGNNGPSTGSSNGGHGAPANHSRGAAHSYTAGPQADRDKMNGMYSTGSGGGGGGQSPIQGGNGGSGILILSYPIAYRNYADALNPGLNLFY